MTGTRSTPPRGRQDPEEAGMSADTPACSYHIVDLDGDTRLRETHFFHANGHHGAVRVVVRTPNPAELLPNPHAGDILFHDFMAPVGLTVPVLADAIGVTALRLDDVIAGRAAIDADLDHRLAVHFGMLLGFFLGLQTDFDDDERRRARILDPRLEIVWQLERALEAARALPITAAPPRAEAS